MKKPRKNIWIIWFVISVVFAVIIHVLYHIPGPYWLQPVWSAGEILTYVSSVALGLLALWQNSKIQEEHYSEIQRSIAVNHLAQFCFDVNRVDVFNSNVNSDADYHQIHVFDYNGCKAFEQSNLQYADTIRFGIIIKNIGNCLATNFMIEDEKGEYEKAELNCTLDENNDKQYILPSESGYLCFDIKKEELTYCRIIKLYLVFSNSFGSKYRQKIEVMSVEAEQCIVISPIMMVEIIDQ